MIGAGGPLEEISGLLIFADAARLVVEAGYDVEFVIACHAREQISLRYLANQLGIAERVTVTDYPIAGPDFWSVLDIYCQPAVSASAGRMLMLAPARALPCIATNVKGLAGTLIDSGRDGLLVPAADPSAQGGDHDGPRRSRPRPPPRRKCIGPGARTIQHRRRGRPPGRALSGSGRHSQRALEGFCIESLSRAQFVIAGRSRLQREFRVAVLCVGGGSVPGLRPPIFGVGLRRVRRRRAGEPPQKRSAPRPPSPTSKAAARSKIDPPFCPPVRWLGCILLSSSYGDGTIHRNHKIRLAFRAMEMLSKRDKK